MRVGVVACGYADGYPRARRRARHAGARRRRAHAHRRPRVDGHDHGRPRRRCPTRERRQRGRSLWGRADDGTVLPIDEVAPPAGTVGYELMCALRAARADTRRRLMRHGRAAGRRRARSRSPRSARRARAGRTSTRCRARSICASTSRASSLPEDGEGAPARARRPAHERRRRDRHQGAAPSQPGAEPRATRSRG